MNKYITKLYLIGSNLVDENLVCFVEDTGKGIDDEQKHNILKPFVKLEQGDVRFHSGAGLGLAICKQIATLMKGDLYFESERGKGTRFTFKIPIT